MIRKASKLALAAAAALCLPAAAQAGTSTDTKTASFTVLNQCSITGATLDLGTFMAQQTWGDVTASLGRYEIGTANYTPGSRGETYLNLGSITCDAGVPTILDIAGTSTDPDSNRAIKMSINNKVGKFLVYVAKVGNYTVPDDYPAEMPGKGQSVGWSPIYSGFGSGVAQPIIGSVVFMNGGSSSAKLTDQLGAAGTFTDSLTYTLAF